MNKVTQIRDKLAELIETLTVENGYSRTIAPNHIHKFLDRARFGQKEMKHFPKVFIVIDGGDVIPEVSRRFARELSFMLIYVDKEEATEKTGSPILQERTENVIEDFLCLFANHPDLDGLVNSATIASFVTDGGLLYPEASATFRLDVNFYDQY